MQSLSIVSLLYTHHTPSLRTVMNSSSLKTRGQVLNICLHRAEIFMTCFHRAETFMIFFHRAETFMTFFHRAEIFITRFYGAGIFFDCSDRETAQEGISEKRKSGKKEKYTARTVRGRAITENAPENTMVFRGHSHISLIL